MTTGLKVEATFLDDDALWQAVLDRNSKYDGLVYYSVSTTGIYCRPSCSSRRPRRENVTYHRSSKEAEDAGYRACKRCMPDQLSRDARRTAQVAQLCRIIDASEEALPLETLAAAIKASTSHTHRLFKQVTGLTPKQYQNEYRKNQTQRLLGSSGSVTEAIFASGHGSAAGFYRTTRLHLGMQPRSYRAGGANERIRFAIAESSLGAVLVAATDKGICAIFLGDDPQALLCDLVKRFPRAELIGADRAFDTLVAQVVGLVDHPTTPIDLPLDLRGTIFQQQVWRELQRIPPGQTSTYSELAQRLSAPAGARAVAGACAANSLAIAVPCHRVVRRDGSLSGYRWGVERKRVLLGRESGK